MAESAWFWAGGDVALGRQVGEEGSDLRRAEVAGMAETLGRLEESDVALDPPEVAGFGAEARSAAGAVSRGTGRGVSWDTIL